MVLFTFSCRIIYVWSFWNAGREYFAEDNCFLGGSILVTTSSFRPHRGGSYPFWVPFGHCSHTSRMFIARVAVLFICLHRSCDSTILVIASCGFEPISRVFAAIAVVPFGATFLTGWHGWCDSIVIYTTLHRLVPLFQFCSHCIRTSRLILTHFVDSFLRRHHPTEDIELICARLVFL